MEKGIALPTRAIVIIVLLLLVLAVLAYFFTSSGGLIIGPVIDESRLDKECNQWKYYGYSYSKFNNTNYPSLASHFGNPVRAKEYCQNLGTDITVIGGCDSDKCEGEEPSWAEGCCCENKGDESSCDEGESNCGWGERC